jgi:hypothetical protein
MGWGTQFKTDIYLSRVSLKNISEVNDAIAECESMIKMFEQDLLILASLNNTPKKGRDLELVIFDIRSRVNEAFEGAKEEIINLTKLTTLKEHLEDGGEVENV